MKCTACEKEATRAMTLFIETKPYEQEGYLSYKKIPGVEAYFLCDEHALHIQTVSIETHMKTMDFLKN